MATIKRVSGDYAIESVNPGDSITLATDTAIITGNLTVTGAASFANLSTDRIFSGTSNVIVSVPSGNITVGVAGTGNVVVFTSNSMQLAGNFTATGNVVASTLSTTGNITGGNLVSTGNLLISRDASAGTPEIRFNDTDTTVADGTVLGQIVWYTSDVIPGARSTTIVQSIANGTAGNANMQFLTSTGGAAASVKMTILSNGNVGIGNSAPVHLLAVQGAVYTSSTVTAVGNVTAGNVSTAGLVTATGNVQGGNLVTAGVVSATANITGGNITTAGAVAAGSAGISTTGNIDGGNLRTTGRITSTGNVTATDYFGTSLSVSGNVTSGNISVGTLVQTANANVTTSLTGTGIGVENFVYQSVDANISSATPANIGSLQFTALANNAYRFEAYVTLVPDGAMTVAPAILFSTGSAQYTTQIQTTSTSALSVATKTTSDDVATTYAMTGTDARTLLITGWFYNTGNTAVVMRLQNSTGNITVKTGSWLSYSRIA